jgi:hypothetical protein
VALTKNRLTNPIGVVARAGLLLALTGVVLLGAACSSDQLEVNPLYSPPDSYDFSGNPELLERILAGPHGYFRFVNIPFGRTVCRKYQDLWQNAPLLNLHGDAHVEQYAVTDLGRGLTDFDDSSTGPGFLDLMRFGVSLLLLCRENGWEDYEDEMLEQFLDAYRVALVTQAPTPEPSIVRRIKGGFKSDRKKYFQWVESIMEPMADSEAAELVGRMKGYIASQLEANEDLTQDFFEVVSVGHLKLGIGSALNLKYLVRLRGPSGSPDDDVVLELKEVRDIGSISCVRALENDPFRILISQARIAYQPFDFLGYVDMGQKKLWVHSWVENYVELKIGEAFQSPEEVMEVAIDVGTQLGLGHPKTIASPLDTELRRAQVAALDGFSNELTDGCRRLSRQAVQAWQMFKSEVESGTQ